MDNKTGNAGYRHYCCDLVYGTFSKSTALKLFQRSLRPAIQFLVLMFTKFLHLKKAHAYISLGGGVGATVRTATFMRTDIFLVIRQ